MSSKYETNTRMSDLEEQVNRVDYDKMVLENIIAALQAEINSLTYENTILSQRIDMLEMTLGDRITALETRMALHEQNSCGRHGGHVTFGT